MAIAIRTSLADIPLAPGFTPNRPERPAKSEGGKPFVLKSDYAPAGDQPAAVSQNAAAQKLLSQADAELAPLLNDKQKQRLAEEHKHMEQRQKEE